MDSANCCCNVLWFIFGGLEICLIWCIYGVALCCTIIGIPLGIQCFKIGCFALFPFGKEIVEKQGGATFCDCILNIIWIILGGLIIAFFECFVGVLYCITICGIPFGLQHFKLAQIALTPFGRTILDTGNIPNRAAAGQPIIVVTQPQPAYAPPYYGNPSPY